MQRTARRAFLAAALIAGSVVLATLEAHATDYDPQSGAWNGLQELIRIAQTANVDLRPAAELEWRNVRRGDGLLVIYPLAHVEPTDLSNFLEEGGRLGILDDFGESSQLLRFFQIRQNAEVGGESRSAAVPGLLVARRRMEHSLSEGVDAIVTNAPTAVSHPRLPPIFAFGNDASSGLVVAGQVGRGRIVVGGDPSVLINTMMRFAGNRQFARNLLVYLAERPGGRVHLVHARFGVRGFYRARGRARSAPREAIDTFNAALARLATHFGDTPASRTAALIVCVLALALTVVRTWGRRPSDRFGPTGPRGAAASIAEKVALFSKHRANLLYAALVAKRAFERSLLREVGLSPPTDVGEVLSRARERLDEAQRNELRALLLELDSLAIPAHEGGPSRLAHRRFLSLFYRIDAILAALRTSR